jgi:4-amino-4-deoxy-L-arabinose transferase-like glycosyltransferase
MFKFTTFEKLMLITFLAFILRVWNLETNPAALNQDEAVNGFDAFTLSLNLKDHHGNFLPPMLQSFNDWASPTLTYLTVPFVKLFGLSVFTTRLANAIFGVICVPLIFYIIKRLTGSKLAGLLIAFVTATTPFMISLSRWAIPPSIVPFCLLLFIWAVLRLLDTDYTNSKKVIINNILVTVSATSLVYSYPTMKIFGPLAALLLLGVYYKTHLKKLIPSILVFFALISPIFYLTLFQPEVYNARYESVKVTARGETMVGGFSARYLEYLTPFFLTGESDGNRMHHVPQYGPINELFTFFIYFGLILALYLALERKNQNLFNQDDNRFYLYLFGLFLLAPIAPSLTIDHTILTRGIQVLILSLVFIGISFGYLEKVIKDIEFKKILIGVFGFFVLLSCSSFFGYYITTYREESKGNFQYGIKEMYSYLKTNESKFDKVEIADINQPYIYYLFFNKVEPGNYEVKDMNCNIGKYYFCGVDKNSASGKQLVTSIKDEKDKIWFFVYQKAPREWIVFR